MPPPAPSLGSCGLGLGTEDSQGLTCQTPLNASSSSHVDMGPSQCHVLNSSPGQEERVQPCAGRTQRDQEAHVLQRPHLRARIAVLWESGKGVLEGSLEEAGLRGLYL